MADVKISDHDLVTIIAGQMSVPVYDSGAPTANKRVLLGTASVRAIGTSAGNVVELDGSARLPAVDGSQLTGLLGGGDMTAAVYDPQAIAADAFSRANHTGTQTLATISDAGSLAGLSPTPTSGHMLIGNGTAFAGQPVSGDVMLNSAGSTTVGDDAVTNTKLANMAQATFKGRADGAGTGDPVDLSATQALTIIKTVDGAASGLDADTVDGIEGAALLQKTQLAAGAITPAAGTLNLTGTNGQVLKVDGAGNIAAQDEGSVPTTLGDLSDVGDGTPTSGHITVGDGDSWESAAMSGDATLGPTGAVTIANNAVTNAKAQDMAQATIKGRADAAGTGDPTDLSAAQVRTIINVEDGAANVPTTVRPVDADWTYSTEGRLVVVEFRDLTANRVANFPVETTTALDGALVRVVNSDPTFNVTATFADAGAGVVTNILTPGQVVDCHLRASDGQWFEVGKAHRNLSGALAVLDTVSTAQTDGLAQHRLLGRYNSGSGAFEPIARDTLTEDASPASTFQLVGFDASNNIRRTNLASLPSGTHVPLTNTQLTGTAYVFENGIADWVTTTEYTSGDLAKNSEGNILSADITDTSGASEPVTGNSYNDGTITWTVVGVALNPDKKRLWTSNASTVAITVHSSIAADAEFEVLRLGVGAVTVTGSGLTFNGNGTLTGGVISLATFIRIASSTDLDVEGETGEDSSLANDLDAAGFSIGGNTLVPIDATGSQAITTSGKRITTAGSITIPNAAGGDGFWQGLIEVGADTHDWTFNSILLDLSVEGVVAGEVYSVAVKSASVIDIAGPAGPFTEADFS